MQELEGRGVPRHPCGASGAHRPYVRMARAVWTAVVVAAGAVHCNSTTPNNPDGGCQLDDQNGVSGGTQPIDLTVSDTAFSVGGPDSGSTQPNITVENSSTVILTMFNVGTTPHDFKVSCQLPSSDNCEMTWCFPAAASIPPVQPGASATVTFVAPFQEGTYLFVSDVGGDSQTGPDGGVTGLVGEFVLM
jgi:hypothetical protein